MDQDSIIRVERDAQNPYFMMVRSTAQDSRLSFSARGVLAYLLSKPNDWKLRPTDIQSEGNIGREACKTLLDELENMGYITVERKLKQVDGKFFSNSYTVYEKPYTADPSTAEPETVKPPYTYKREEQNKEDILTGSRARRDLLRQLTSNAETVLPVENQYALFMESIAKSALADYVSRAFGKPFTIDKSVANAMSGKVRIKEQTGDFIYPAPIDLYDNVPAFRKFVETRCASLKAVPGMTPLNALKNLCKIAFDPNELPGNSKKMPGYHVWFQKNEAEVKLSERIVEELGAPPDEDD